MNLPERLQEKHFNIITGLLLGASLWHFSPEVFGSKEPWDASVLLYLFCIFLFGIISSLPSPKNQWVGPFAVYLGQYAYIWTVHGPGNLWPLSLILGFFFLLPAFVGSFLVYLIYNKMNQAGQDKIQ